MLATVSAMTSHRALNRRQALTTSATLGVSLPLLAACGGGEAGDPGSGSAAAGEPFAATSDVPVGGGAIFPDAGVIVTQPEEGTFRGFKNACSHQGCPLSDVTETINCSCHGSRFDLDGVVLNGPATSDLAGQTLDVQGGDISLA